MNRFLQHAYYFFWSTAVIQLFFTIGFMAVGIVPVVSIAFGITGGVGVCYDLFINPVTREDVRF